MSRNVTRRAAGPVAIVAGALAQRPCVAGHAWVFLNWLSGLRALGYDVVFVDRLDPEMQTEPHEPVEDSREWRWLRRVLRSAGLDGKVALLVDGGRRSLGMGRDRLLECCRRADVLFDVMGYLGDPEVAAAVSGPRVFVDIDPGFPQMWDSLGLCDPFAGHDAFVTVGLAVGEPESSIPTCGRNWVRTPPPVDLDAWHVRDPLGSRTRPVVSDIATWRGPYGPIVYGGTTYGLRVHELRDYASVPEELPELSFRMALAIDPDDIADRSLLESSGWRLDDPRDLAGTLDGYRRYVADSDLEFSVAKQMYVRSRGGWFSDRSACYLAAGRPVVAQETGFSDHLPTGDGLVSFGDPDEAVSALREVTGDLPRHRDAARKIAEAYLDAPTVLRHVIDLVGAS
jgi:hypothetical protein